MTDETTSGEISTERERTGRAPAPGSPALHLLIFDSDYTWRPRVLPASGAMLIGRAPDADVHLDEPRVSRRHARLDVTEGSDLLLTDLGSRNGTWVGKQLVRGDRITVRPGEFIQIGRTHLVVRELSLGPVLPTEVPPGRPPQGMAAVEDLVARAAPTPHYILLLGETGVGKGVIAERIHLRSKRPGPFLQLNCAGLSAQLLQSELFGHVKGAFTGASENKMGLLEAAAGGTVFLDEIGEMPRDVQAILLVAIEKRVVRRVGSTRTLSIDVRFISATHRDLAVDIRGGRFREDLYYRIGQLSISIPPLRERRDEIDGLAALFACEEAAARDPAAPAPRFDDAARAALHRYSWPGNIRQLRNVVRRAVLFADGDLISERVLAAAILPEDACPPPLDPAEDAERQRVVDALEVCGGNQSRAALMLGMARNTLIRKIQKYNIKRPRAGGAAGSRPGALEASRP